MGFIFFMVFMLLAVIVLPPYLTFGNFANLFTKKHLIAHLLLTVIAGGIMYHLLFEFIADGNGYWLSLPEGGVHEMFNTDYKFTVQTYAVIGLAGLLFIGIFSDYPAPFMSIAAMGAIITGTVLNIFVALHEAKVLFSYTYAAFAVVFFYAYQLNLLILAYIHMKNCIRRQTLMISISVLTGNKSRLYRFLSRPRNMFVFSCIAAILIIILFEAAFLLSYHETFPLFKAFTQTSDWTFSLQEAPPTYDNGY